MEEGEGCAGRGATRFSSARSELYRSPKRPASSHRHDAESASSSLPHLAIARPDSLWLLKTYLLSSSGSFSPLDWDNIVSDTPPYHTLTLVPALRQRTLYRRSAAWANRR